MSERCMVHLIHRGYKRCDRTDIASYVQLGNRRIPLCMKHHIQICGERSKREWSSEPKKRWRGIKHSNPRYRKPRKRKGEKKK